MKQKFEDSLFGKYYDLGKLVDDLEINDEHKSPVPNTCGIHGSTVKGALIYFEQGLETARKAMKNYGHLEEETLQHPDSTNRVTILSCQNPITCKDLIYVSSFQQKTTENFTPYFEIKKRTNIPELQEPFLK